MRTLRLLLVGAVIWALLGLSGIGAAAAAGDEALDDEWWKSDSEWLVLEAMKQFHLERQGVIEEEIKEANYELSFRTGNLVRARIWRAVYRALEGHGYPAGYVDAERLRASRRYLDLVQESVDIPRRLEGIAGEQLAIETDLDREKAAKESKAFLEKYPVPVGDNVHYLVQCLEDGKEFFKQHGNDVTQLKAAVDGTEFCLKNPERPMTRVIRILYWDDEAADETVPAPL